MAWTYSAWRSQSTVAAQIAMLKLHLAEVSDAVGADVSGSDMSVQRQNNMELLKHLEAQLDKLNADPAARIGGGMSFADFGRP